ncbi:SNF2-related protein [Pueribacillus sp. YX66]|uniref:SNF2-related protein n=1 Tax=Pueribacillus sp. YX66 TaxID=3229242 RepID=UPI00358D4ACA
MLEKTSESKVLDNRRFGFVGDTLKENIRPDSKLAIMSAYFTIYAFDSLKRELMDAGTVRILFNEPLLEIKKIIHRISGTEQEVKFRNELSQARIAKECADWIKAKVEIKSLKQSISDSTLYHIQNKDRTEFAIHGSSDFTSSGLGYTPSTKYELNTATENNEMTKKYVQWFNELWENEQVAKAIKSEVLQSLEMLYKNYTRQFIYFFTLYHIFKDFLHELDEDELVNSKTGIKNTIIWNKLYKFQKDGVVGAIDKLERYNGCIIADSVGLGKTFEALAVIKYYELRNFRVLVLCPKKLRDNWLIYTQNDKRNIFAGDRFNYDVLNHTDLSRYSGFSGDINLETINWSNYDLIVIDESHNFRNNTARDDRETRYSRLMDEVIKSGVKSKVLMLSATPVNNKMNDLKVCVKLFSVVLLHQYFQHSIFVPFLGYRAIAWFPCYFVTF